jgi:CxxC motif-containing protein
MRVRHKEIDMSKTFTVAGVSTPRGQMAVQYRFANGTAAARTKVLVKNGDSAITLFDLPEPMTKEQATVFVNNALGTSYADRAPVTKAQAKAQATAKIVPGKREVKRQEKVEAASKAKDEAKAIAKRVAEAQKSVTRTEIDADIDESDIPEFIKRDFRKS